MRETNPDSDPVKMRRTNLPFALSSFIGREKELDELVELSRSARLLTLTGTAGCGKTRLALRLAETIGDAFPNGTLWLELGQLRSPSLVAQELARALRIPFGIDQSLRDTIVDKLRSMQLLLILDNCEHLLFECVELAELLLANTEVRIVATSREPLHLHAVEVRYDVAPLPFPEPGTAPDRIAELDAVRLFLERARSVLPAFGPDSANVEVIGEICRKLDGIPLAIELASARVNVLTVEQIHTRLTDRFGLLREAGALSRSQHQTLWAAIEWSYHLLAPAERALLRRLSVFYGGCSLATVERVCVDDKIPSMDVLDLLSALVRKSLIVAQTLHRTEARYTLLETINEFAYEKLVESGETPRLRDYHLRCYRDLVEETAPKLKGPYQHLWLEHLQDERENIRSAMIWAESSGDIESGLRMAIALYEFWIVRGFGPNDEQCVERMLERADTSIHMGLRANAMANAALLAGIRGNEEKQVAWAERAADLATEADETEIEALVWTLVGISQGARARGDYETELAVARRIIQLERELGDDYLLGISLSTLSPAAMNAGELEEARGMLGEGLMLLRESRDPYRIAQSLNYNGDLARCLGDYPQARRFYEESLALLSDHDAARDLASVLHNLAYTKLRLGDELTARDYFQRSLVIHHRQGNNPGIAECVMGFGATAIQCCLTAVGVQLFSAALVSDGDRITRLWPATRAEYDYYLEKARSRLTPSEFQEAWSAGALLSLSKAVALVQRLSSQIEISPVRRSRADELTRREREVAKLIVLERSNGEIADELSISKRTVEKHVANIMAKLGAENRAGIVRRILEADLTARSR